ncbi:MAG TPA: ABC transporter substrate-binding protein [Rhodocyclaceae bacterium]|nr:ABC transporter substrate-binding protein [Rhodocyclaceae bacterium]
MRSKLSLLLILVLMSPAVQALEQVRLQLRWLHQFQFAGYYVALEKGYYRDAGLDVKILPGGPDVPRPVEEVLQGRADFAITGSGLVIEHMRGQPVVALAAIMQTSPIVWIVRGDSRIRTPQDLVGKKVMMMPPPESAELLTTFLQEGISLNRVSAQPTTFRIDDLINRRVDAYDGYISNEPFLLRERGVPYRVINPRDYDVNFYADVLMTNARLANDDPEKVRAFTDASLAGWRYALTHIDETVQLIHDRYAPDRSLAHLRYEAEEIRKLVMPELVQLGHMNPERWDYIARSYIKVGMAVGEPDLNAFLFDPRARELDERLAWRVGLGSLLLVLLVAAVAVRYVRVSRALRHEVALRRQTEGELRESNEQLEALATTDRLTGIWNRRKFEMSIESEIGRAQRYGGTFALLFFDIDHFKAINDSFGHAIGDEVLCEVASRVQAVLRDSDMLARWGGEEFALMLPSTPLSDAGALAEKLRLLLAEQPFAKVGYVTASFGVTCLRPADNPDQLMRRADRALYRAKSLGRNRVVCPQTRDGAPDMLDAPSVSQLVWSDAYALGVPLLDGHHRRLFDLANAAISAVAQATPDEESSCAMARLVEEMATHCVEEEALMERIGYLHTDHHRADHAELLDEAHELLQRWRSGDISHGALVDFLVQQLIAQHILADDRALAQALLSRMPVPSV